LVNPAICRSPGAHNDRGIDRPNAKVFAQIGGRASLIAPGTGAVPGAGCGNAVDAAVWKVTLPSTF